MTDPITPATVARADERRRPHGIEDESAVDKIIDDLHQLGLIYYEPLSGQYWTSDLPAVIEHAATVALDRAGTKVITALFRTERRKDVRVGMYEAVAKMKEVRL